jgi:hypothetical protein
MRQLGPYGVKHISVTLLNSSSWCIATVDSENSSLAALVFATSSILNLQGLCCVMILAVDCKDSVDICCYWSDDSICFCVCKALVTVVLLQ